MGVTRRRVPVKAVKVTTTHDRLTLVATYATGGTVRFTVGRSGDRLDWGGSGDAAAERANMAAFMRVAEFGTAETNAERLARLKALCESVDSVAELGARCRPSAQVRRG